MRTLIFSFAISAALLAQDTTAVLEGQITDASGGAISGAIVQAVNSKTGYTRNQTTTSAGTYHLALLVGEYELRVSAPNFAQYVQTGIELNVGQTARLDVQL